MQTRAGEPGKKKDLPPHWAELICLSVLSAMDFKNLYIFFDDLDDETLNKIIHAAEVARTIHCEEEQDEDNET